MLYCLHSHKLYSMNAQVNRFEKKEEEKRNKLNRWSVFNWLFSRLKSDLECIFWYFEKFNEHKIKKTEKPGGILFDWLKELQGILFNMHVRIYIGRKQERHLSHVQYCLNINWLRSTKYRRNIQDVTIQHIVYLSIKLHAQ